MKVQIEFEVTDIFKYRCLENKLTPKLIAEEAMEWYQLKDTNMIEKMAVDYSWADSTIDDKKTYYRIN